MSQAPDVSMPHAGDILGGRYVLLERIGAGGMGRVFRARDEVLRRDVAIKIFATDGADEADPLRRMSEARTLAALDHPSLVTLFDARLDADAHVYLVMELIDGPSLQRRIEHGSLTPAEVAGIVEDLAGALAAVHDAGIVHRDVKPSNVLLRPVRSTERGFEAVLADFGVAHLIDATRLTTPGTVIGTAAYLAPEQVRGEAPQPTSDIYALGLLAIESLTRLHPFGGGSVQETLLARLARQPDVPADLAADWRALLADMTAADPADRPTAEIVARRAAGLGAGADVPTRPEALTDTAPWALLGFTGAMDATQPIDRTVPAGDVPAAAAVAPTRPDLATAVVPAETAAPPRPGVLDAATADAAAADAAVADDAVADAPVADAATRRRARSRPSSSGRRRWFWVGTAALAAVVAAAHVAAFSLGSAGGVPLTGGVPAPVPSIAATTPAPAATDPAPSSEVGATVAEPVSNGGDDTVSSPGGASNPSEADATRADGVGGASAGGDAGSVGSGTTAPTTADGGTNRGSEDSPGGPGSATGPGGSTGQGGSAGPGGSTGPGQAGAGNGPGNGVGGNGNGGGDAGGPGAGNGGGAGNGAGNGNGNGNGGGNGKGAGPGKG